MASSHGKKTVITIATKDISPFCNNSELTRGADKHDLTGYGVDDQVVDGGIRRHDFTCEGFYDTSITVGPRAAFRPAIGTVVACTRKPEGTGTGKPLETFNALVEEYKETSPVADYVKWAAKLTVSGPIVDSTQP